MHARYRQGGDVHGHTAVQIQGADEEEETSARDGPVNRTDPAHSSGSLEANVSVSCEPYLHACKENTCLNLENAGQKHT